MEIKNATFDMATIERGVTRFSELVNTITDDIKVYTAKKANADNTELIGYYDLIINTLNGRLAYAKHELELYNALANVTDSSAEEDTTPTPSQNPTDAPAEDPTPTPQVPTDVPAEDPTATPAPSVDPTSIDDKGNETNPSDNSDEPTDDPVIPPSQNPTGGPVEDPTPDPTGSPSPSDDPSNAVE